MKRLIKIFSITFILCFILVSLTACEIISITTTFDPSTSTTTASSSGTIEEVDYVSQLKLDMNSSTVKSNVTVAHYVDGDTTHFNVSGSTFDEEILKARYLAVNTPESTGQIEEWGKRASNFTKNALKSATSIIIESDDGNWNLDSTGGRYLVWVWYRTDESEDYRNLNLELLQNGLAIASNTARNRYGEICVKALEQSKALKKYVFSGEKDPDFYYGNAQVLSIKEIRANPEKYERTNVAFEGVVTKNYNNTLFVEDYDEESDTYFGMQVYLGYALSGDGLGIVKIGNRVLFVGSFQYYETGGTYQLTNIRYQVMRPNDPTNIRLISTGNEASFREIDVEEFNNDKITIELKDPETEATIEKELDYAEALMNTSVIVKNLEVTRTYTTSNQDSSSYGSLTLTCKVGNETIKVRTVPLYDAAGQLITEDAFKDKTINIKGFVDFYESNYQIKVFSMKDIEFVEDD